MLESLFLGIERTDRDDFGGILKLRMWRTVELVGELRLNVESGLSAFEREDHFRYEK